MDIPAIISVDDHIIESAHGWQDHLPTALGLPSIHSDAWDVLWAACEATDTVVNMDIGSSSAFSTTRSVSLRDTVAKKYRYTRPSQRISS
ncbi:MULTISPECIES: hypothetical protein [unclassified Frankia]|uniref:hypothetical protein n=1 Tax=unclassified Frankia TaxID=2632575 RepID=UPI002AD3CA20|nr:MULTISPECIES: hypothetical protein [unclassified Frankia]